MHTFSEDSTIIPSIFTQFIHYPFAFTDTCMSKPKHFYLIFMVGKVPRLMDATKRTELVIWTVRINIEYAIITILFWLSFND